MKNVFKTLFTISLMIVSFPGMSGGASSFGGAYATFAGKFGGEVSLRDLSQHHEIGIAGCAAGSQIIRFTLVVRSGERRKEFVGDSARLTNEMIQALGELRSGDTFLFENMQAKLPKGNRVNVLGKVFTVISGTQGSE